MDTLELNRAYHDLLVTAEALTGSDRLTGAAGADVDWTLAHIALSDRLLAATARSVLAGTPAGLDNSAATGEPLAALLTATTHPQRIELVRQNAAELAAVLERIPDGQAGAPVDVRLVDKAGNPAYAGSAPWGAIIGRRAQDQLPGHTARLAALLEPVALHGSGEGTR